MGIFLRLTLTSIFIGLAIYVHLNPTSSKEYVDLRYKSLYSKFILETPVGRILPGSLIATSGNLAINISVGLLAFIGLAALCGLGCVFKSLSMTFVILSTLFHLPFATSTAEDINSIGEIRKLMFLGVMACGILVYKGSHGCHGCPCTGEEKKE